MSYERFMMSLYKEETPKYKIRMLGVFPVENIEQTKSGLLYTPIEDPENIMPDEDTPIKNYNPEAAELITKKKSNEAF